MESRQQEVVNIIKECLELRSDLSLKDTLNNLDPLEVCNAASQIENELKVSFDNREVRSWETFGCIVESTLRKLSDQSSPLGSDYEN